MQAAIVINCSFINNYSKLLGLQPFYTYNAYCTAFKKYKRVKGWNDWSKSRIADNYPFCLYAKGDRPVRFLKNLPKTD